MKILSTAQIRDWDAYTIACEPVASIDLMERAALAFVRWFTDQFPDTDRPLCVLVGPGNNGGDGLAIARLLHQRLYTVHLYRCHVGMQVSADFQTNWERLPQWDAIAITHLHEGDALAEFPSDAILIDALFGAGLNRPIAGYWAELVQYLNTLPLTRVAVDVPSGLLADTPTEGVCLEAQHTFSFEVPKLAFFMPENQHRVGQWAVGSIGLHPEFVAKEDTPYHYTDATAAQALLRPRHRFDHKGTFGHALLIAGSYGKAGAAVLAAEACLRSGAGLTTVHAPACAYLILQTAVPEAMVSVDAQVNYISNVPELKAYKAIGAGCGWGQAPDTALALRQLLEQCTVPLVLDADALNLLAQDAALLAKLPRETMLTPHPKEFERLFGATPNGFERLVLLRAKAQQLGVVIVLKGAFTCIALPDGTCHFNATGNPGMATGGSGDVLTGILTGLLAQGYPPADAAVLGVYLHGLAGDLAARELGYEALIAGDLNRWLSKAFRELQEFR